MTEAGAVHKILVICLGNPDCGDDGIGALVALKLKERLPSGVCMVQRRGDMLSLVEDFAGCEAAVCVDAAEPMGKPGDIHHIDANIEELPHELLSASTHGFGLIDAIELARALNCAPKFISIYAVEGSCFNPGTPVTPIAADAAEETACLVAVEVERLSATMRSRDRRISQLTAPHECQA